MLILPFLEPRGISDMAIYLGGFWYYLDLIFNLLKYISFLCIVILIIYELQQPSPMILLITIFQIWTMVSSVINHNFTRSIAINAISAVGISIFTDYCVRKNRFLQLANMSAIILAGTIVINFITMILWPGGMYTDTRGWTTNYFLGYRNLHIYFYLPFFVLYGLTCIYKKGELSKLFFAMLAFSFVASLISKSSTTSACMFALMALTFFYSNKKIPKIINPFSIFFSMIVFSFLCIFFNIQEYFNSFLGAVFGKDASFSTRTYIWQRAMLLISRKPVIGNGNTLVTNVFNVKSHAHNEYLDLLLIGGMVLFLFFGLMILLITRKLLKSKCFPAVNLFLFILLSYALLFFQEARRDDPLLFLVFVLACNIDIFDHVKDTEQNIKHRYIRLKWKKS